MVSLGRPVADIRSPRLEIDRWTGDRALRLVVIGVAVAFVMPAIYIGIRAGQLWTADGIRQSVGPTARSLVLAVAVSGTTAALGTVLAWLVAVTDVPSARFLRLVLPLALVLPSFVGAAAYLAALAPSGPLYWIVDLVVQPLTGTDRPVRIGGFWPSWAVLSLFTYPYVFLPVLARAQALSPTLNESARLLGRSAWGTFVAVTLPQLRPAVISGTLLVFLYSLSEFGAVQLLRYDTLTRVIFSSFLADRGVSFVAAAILMLLAVAVVAVERTTRPASGPDPRSEIQIGASVELGWARWPAAAGAWAVVALALVVPITSLAVWSGRGLLGGRVNLGRLPDAAINTALAGTVTAALAVGAMIPIAFLSIRHRSRLSSVCSGAVLTGFALPGVVLALSMVFWTLRTPGFSWLYQSFPALIAVYIVHFGAQALGATETAVRAVPDRLRESASLLEASRLRRFLSIQIPLMRPGLVSGAGLVLLSTVKELPATLLLAPIGFDTLATRIWSGYSEGFYGETATAALVLLAVSGLLTWVVVLRPNRSTLR
jgi:iron(III) transport system permease protein